MIPAFVGWDDSGAAFTAVTQLGTLAAVLLYFRGDLWTIGRARVAGLRDRDLRGEPESMIAWFILAGTVPIVIGFAQAAALIPGVSRSGATISAGLFRTSGRRRGYDCSRTWILWSSEAKRAPTIARTDPR